MNTETTGIEPENPETAPEGATPEKAAPEESVVEKPVAKEPQPQSEPLPKEVKSRRKGGGLSFLAFVFSLAALAGTGWMWWQGQSSDGQDQLVSAEITRLENNDSGLTLKVQQIREEVDSLAAGDMGAQFTALQQRMESDRSKMADVEQTISEQLALSRSFQAAATSIQGRLIAAEAALSGMATQELDAGGELDIAEVDYLLRLANERLKLFLDPVAADQALEVADMHLAALDNPIYLGVRQDIANARRELAAVNVPDYLDIAGQLDSVQDKIASLPFPEDDVSRTASGAVEGEGWWEKAKSVFSSMVTIRRSTDEENQKISLQDKDYIRQRVWLQLEIAHLSLMRRDQQAFRTSLQRTQESISTWFNSGHSDYQDVWQAIDALSEIEIQVDVPDITAPWATLRVLKSRPAMAMPVPVLEEEEENE